MLTINDLKNLSDNDPIWDLLKSDSLRKRFADLVLDLALESKPSEVDRLTGDALRAYAARVEFAKHFNSKIPNSPQSAVNTLKQITPEPVE